MRAFSDIFRLLRLASDSSHPLFFATILLRILRACTPLVLLWIPKLIIDDLVQLSRYHTVHTKHIWVLAGVQFGIAVLNDVLARLASLSEGLLGEKFATHVNTKLIVHAASLDLSHFEQAAIYDKLERARSQTGARLSLFFSILSIVQEIATLITLTIGFIVMSRWLLVVMLVSAAPSFLYEMHFGAWRYSVVTRLLPERRRLDYFRELGTSLESAKEVRLLNLGPHLASLYSRQASKMYHEMKRLGTVRAFLAFLPSAVTTIAYYGAYGYTIAQCLLGAITLGTFTFLSGSFSRASASVERASLGINIVSEDTLLLSDLFDFFDLKPESSKSGSLPFPKEIRTGIEFCNVSFSYPGSSHLVVRDVNFRLNADETLALVGENGSGKSTIVKLMTRLYDPVEGHITLDGVDLRHYNLDSLRRGIAVVFQDYVRYEMSIRDNVSIGDISREINNLELQRALIESGAAQFISYFPAGYDQMLGRRFESGVDLSGGEWQKIALARASIREASFVILDEPSASLDARSESEVFDSFSKLLKQRMAVVISHRLANVRLADKIIVLSHGEIEEQGTHAELIASGRRYAELYEMQAAGYR